MILKIFPSLLAASMVALPLAIPSRVQAQAGTLDASFKSGTGTNESVLAVAIQPADGKILIGGDFTQYDGTSIVGIARLNTDGTVDTTFNVGTGVSGTVNSIAVQSNGQIIIGGNFETVNGVTCNELARLNASGSVDTGFNTSGAGLDGAVYGIAIQSNGQILIAGDFNYVNGKAANYLARLNAKDGSLDTTFNTGTGPDDTIFALALQSNGQVLIGGAFQTYNGATADSIARVNTDGSFDSNFSTGGGTDDNVDAIAIQPNGQIIIGGDFSMYNGTAETRIARINTDGSLDTNFNGGSGANDTVDALAVQLDGSVVAGGAFTSLNGGKSTGIGALTSTGALDTGFNPGTGVQGSVSQLAIEPADGKILVAGGFLQYNAIAAENIARVFGVLPSFFSGQASLGGEVYYLAFPNGNIFGYYNYEFYPTLYHYDLGFEYVINANDGVGGVYLFDFASGHFWYTSPVFAFPYLYDFGLKAFLYYIPNSNSPGHYTTHPRYFSNLTTGKIITQ